MLVEMAKVEIIGPQNRMTEVVGLLHEIGVLHIEDPARRLLREPLPLEHVDILANQEADREDLQDLMVRSRAVLASLVDEAGAVIEDDRLREYERLNGLDNAALIKEVGATLARVEKETSDLVGDRTSIESELELLARYKPILKKIEPLVREVVTAENYESIALLFESRYRAALRHIRSEVERMTHNSCEVLTADVEEETTVAILVFDRRYSEDVHKFLAMENVNQIRLPSELKDMPFEEAFATITERLHLLPGRLSQIKRGLSRVAAGWYSRMSAVREVLTDRLDEIVVIPKFSRTEYAFVVTGWVPEPEVAKLEAALHEKVGDAVVIERKRITRDDYEETPVALRNTGAVAPFSSLLSILGSPRYGTFDPSWMIFLFYPLFFGMIVGDIGYGLIMLATILFVRIKFKDNKGVQVATAVLGPAASMAIVFGFVYGEFFGNILSEHLGWIREIHVGGVQLPFVRTELVTTFMGIAIGVGAIQVILGLVLGIVNGFRTRHMKHVEERGGMLAVLIFVPLLIVLAAIPVVGESLGPWSIPLQALVAAGIFVGMFFTVRGGGVAGAVESISQFSHVASYIRIMAVGLSGAIFADIANEIALKVGPVIGVMVGILLHSLNFAIAAFSPNIHALRLNFYEFFGKFYESGAQQYRPFHKVGS
ncbi:MAG: V-type ATPase 116kDa subunit family protein [Coriobacteriia bacterium]